MNLKYDESLKQIEFYKTHPEYVPFIGDNFDEFRILQVGESHYIGQSDTYAPFGLEELDKWWTDRCDDLYEHPDGNPETKCWGSWYNTRDVMGRFLYKNQRNYSIFMNMIRAFDKAVGGLPQCDDEKQKYHYFAFMNFFQMPALYQGISFKDSLYKASKDTDDPATVYKRAVEKSCAVLDKVIEILQPNAVVFTSKAAYRAYSNHKGKMEEKNKRIINTVHPCCSWWNRPIKRFDGRTGRQELERALSDLLN
jgi:hypothetical protein